MPTDIDSYKLFTNKVKSRKDYNHPKLWDCFICVLTRSGKFFENEGFFLSVAGMLICLAADNGSFVLTMLAIVLMITRLASIASRVYLVYLKSCEIIDDHKNGGHVCTKLNSHIPDDELFGSPITVIGEADTVDDPPDDPPSKIRMN